MSALDKYIEFTADEQEENPIERLRFFLSLSLCGQDWLDVEQFIDDITAQRDALAQENKRLVEALEFARDKISELHLEAGDGDCHYPIINDAIATAKDKP